MRVSVAKSRLSAARVVATLLLTHASALAAPEAPVRTESAAAHDAAPVTGARLERARALFAEAEALREEGDCGSAIARLEEALGIKETPGLRFHLAHCLSEVGRLLEARAAYDRARQLLDRGVSAPDVEALLASAVRRLLEETPQLTVRLAGDTPRATLTIDGRAVVPGKPTPLDPGTHRVVVRAPGYETSETTVRLARRERRALTPVMTAEAVSGDAAPERRGASVARTVVLATEIGIAAAGLSLGIVETVGAFSAGSRVDEQNRVLDQRAPGDTTVCANPASAELRSSCDALSSALDDQRFAETLAAVGYGAGAAGIASFIGTLLLWPSASEGADADASSAARFRARVVPGLAFGAVSGRF